LGHFIGFRGFCIDITERKIRELAAQNELGPKFTDI